MPEELIGRRIPAVDGKVPVLEQAGDYCGPVVGYTDKAAAVFYLLPIARDADAPAGARSVFYVCLPPHIGIENQDGSLTLRESIGNPYWHGYLNAGHKWSLTREQE